MLLRNLKFLKNGKIYFWESLFERFRKFPRKTSPWKLQVIWHLLGMFCWGIYETFRKAFIKKQPQIATSAISCYRKTFCPKQIFQKISHPIFLTYVLILSLHCHFNKFMKRPGTSFLQHWAKNVRNVSHPAHRYLTKFQFHLGSGLGIKVSKEISISITYTM